MHITMQQALKIIREGNVVAIPTDTVYGLAADMLNPQAVDKIFSVKKRPNDRPLIILVSSLSQIVPFIEELPHDFLQLADTFWPGALTLVVPVRKSMISENIRCGLPTVGFRIPAHPVALELIEEFGPLVAPSANMSGSPSSTCATHVENDFGKDFPVLDGGSCLQGMESTILCFHNGKWMISRIGAITLQEITNVLSYEPMPFSAQCSASSYAPKVKLHLSSQEYDGKIKTVLGFTGRYYLHAESVYILGELTNPNSVSHRLYAALRELDEQGIQDAWVDMAFPKEGVLAAVAERLEKAGKWLL